MWSCDRFPANCIWVERCTQSSKNLQHTIFHVLCPSANLMQRDIKHGSPKWKMVEPQDRRSLGPHISAGRTAAQHSETPISGFVLLRYFIHCVIFYSNYYYPHKLATQINFLEFSNALHNTYTQMWYIMSDVLIRAFKIVYKFFRMKCE